MNTADCSAAHSFGGDMLEKDRIAALEAIDKVKKLSNNKKLHEGQIWLMFFIKPHIKTIIEALSK